MDKPTTAQSGSQRQYVDHEGRVWRVVEREVPVQGRSSLFFESDGGWRRVRSFPTDWLALSTEELDNLSHRV